MWTTCGGCGCAAAPRAPRGVGGVKTGGCTSAETRAAPGDDRAGRQAIALSSEPSGQVQTGGGGKTISFSIYVQYTNGEHDLPLNRHANMCYSSVETERTVYKASGRVQRATARTERHPARRVFSWLVGGTSFSSGASGLGTRAHATDAADPPPTRSWACLLPPRARALAQG